MSTPDPYAPRPFHRPLGVAILAILIMIAGALIVIAGIIAVIGLGLLGAFVGGPAGALAGAALGIIVLIIGGLTFAAGSGLWKMRRWAWWLAVILLVIDFLFLAATVLGAILIGVLLLYLVLVRKHFNT